MTTQEWRKKYDEERDVAQLLGKTIVNIEKVENTELIFTTSDGEKYKLYHEQSCCEDVYIDDIVGDLEDLLNTPILQAERKTNNLNPKSDIWTYKDITTTSQHESFTWTFFTIATIKGYVDIKFYGSSNGYYSETGDFIKI